MRRLSPVPRVQLPAAGQRGCTAPMQLSLRVLSPDSGTEHPVTVTAAHGTSGEELSAELARQLGRAPRATVGGVDLGGARVGVPPLVDGATVVLHPHHGHVPAADTRAAPRARTSAGMPGRTRAVHTPDASMPGDAVCLTVVEGTGAGTRLPLARGTHRLVLDGDEPALMNDDSAGGLSLVVDETGIRVLPGGAALHHGDRLRLPGRGACCRLRVERTGECAAGHWPDPVETPAGFTSREADPSCALPLEGTARGRATVAMVAGLLPLVAGLGIALVTHWWFFLVFSVLGAVTTGVGWFADRGARAEQRRRLAAALERDLRRCDRAAPAVAQVVARCRAAAGQSASQPSGFDDSSAHPTPGQDAPPVETPRTPAGAPLSRSPAPVPRWVRLGHGARPAAVARGRGTPLRAVTHPHAPVLVDLAGVPLLVLDVTGDRAARLLDTLVVQLFTGPRAMEWLVVSPAVAWTPPPALLPRTLPSPARPTVLPAPGDHAPHDAAGAAPPGTTVLEVLTPEDAAREPATAGTARVVVARGTASCPEGAVVSETPGGMRLTTHSCDAVPGLSAQEQRTALDFVPDTVSRRTAHRALHDWTSAVGRHPSGRSGVLPRSLGTHELLVPGAGATRAEHPDRAHADPAHPGSGHPAGPLPGPGHSAGRHGSTPLGAVLGVSHRGPERIELDDENPHLLVAGTTGCGKSEVLRTLVAHLALQSPPERLEFVLVDFKGGAALSPLTGLPHVSTLLTDLGPDEVRRALVFLRSELARRERVLHAHGFASMTQVLQAGGGTPVIRELVVVVDEAKMLTDSFPEAAQQLAVVATVGRSLGVHLVLATQRPQGALPADVRANISQALCLRVRTGQESLDMVGTASAAAIPPDLPGRAFLDRGHGVPVEVQCAVLTRLAAPAPEPLRLHFLPAVPNRGGPMHDDARAPWPRALPGLAVPAGAAPVDDASADGSPHGEAGARESSEPGLAGDVVHRDGPVAPAVSSKRGPSAAVQDVRRFWESRNAESARRRRPGTTPGTAEQAVPPSLPRTTPPAPTSYPLVDLGPAENPAEHWSGRLAWHPWEDGPLAVVGRPSAVRESFLSVVARCASIGAGPDAAHGNGAALYAVSASGEGLTDLVAAVRTVPGAQLRGLARADSPADLGHLLEVLRRHLELSAEAAGTAGERAVLAVDDWDRCCQLLRTGVWAHLEDDLLALLAAGTARGLSAVVAGDRGLVAGRGSHAAPNRLFIPGGQSADALLHWPRLPPFSPYDARAAASGPVVRSCGAQDGAPLVERMAVVQLAGVGSPEAPVTLTGGPGAPPEVTGLAPGIIGPVPPAGPRGAGLPAGTVRGGAAPNHTLGPRGGRSGPAHPHALRISTARNATVRAGAASSGPDDGGPGFPATTRPDSWTWPVCFPLPTTWRAPAEASPGLLLGVTRDGHPAVHPWGPGATLLVAGPARSGRTSFLTTAHACLAGPVPPGGRSAHEVVHAAPGSPEDIHALLRALERAARPVTLVLDDADRLPPEALRTLAAAWTPHPPGHDGADVDADRAEPAVDAPGVRLVVGVRLTDSMMGAFPPLMAWRQHADTLLLRPRRVFDGDPFGASLSGHGLEGPPGRGFWVHRGTVEPVQTPLPHTGFDHGSPPGTTARERGGG